MEPNDKKVKKDPTVDPVATDNLVAEQPASSVPAPETTPEIVPEITPETPIETQIETPTEVSTAAPAAPVGTNLDGVIAPAPAQPVEPVQPAAPQPIVAPLFGAPTAASGPKKSNKTLILSLIIGGAVLLIGAFVLIWLFVFGPFSTNYTETNDAAQSLSKNWDNFKSVWVEIVGEDAISGEELDEALTDAKEALEAYNTSLADIEKTSGFKDEEIKAAYDTLKKTSDPIIEKINLSISRIEVIAPLDDFNDEFAEALMSGNAEDISEILGEILQPLIDSSDTELSEFATNAQKLFGNVFSMSASELEENIMALYTAVIAIQEDMNKLFSSASDIAPLTRSIKNFTDITSEKANNKTALIPAVKFAC